MNSRIKTFFKELLWFLEGIIIGFGAIMPGLSGGTLCVAFGMYLPLIWVISHPKENIVKYGKMLTIFAIGVAVGFIGLSGLASWLMSLSNELVVCAFIGFILGTIPELWNDAGINGRSIKSYISTAVGFTAMIMLLLLFKSQTGLQIKADIFGFLLCGILWGFSFIIPGLSSSTLLLFFGLYQPMLDGISCLDMGVIIPLAIGIVMCVLLLSKAVSVLYKKHYGAISHAIIGVVIATVVMILPDWNTIGFGQIICIVCGALLSYAFTRICARLKK